MTRPSALPALAQCSAFEGGSSEYAEAGTVRHTALAKLFNDDPDALDAVPEDQHDGVRWAVDHIRLHAPLADHPIAFEESASFITSEFDEIRGTPDAVCGRVIFDLKWRLRDYTAQMAAYALMFLQRGCPDVEVHILFGECQRYEVLRFDEPSALAIVEPIIAKAKHPEPTACDYCAWCSKRLTCSAFNAPALEAVANREDWKLATWHPSEIEDPEVMAKALRAAPLLIKLGQSIQYHARELWEKKGITIPGFERKERAGKRVVEDVNGAFGATGLDPNQFLACTAVRFTQLEAAYAKAHGMTAAAAKRELKRKLEPFVKTTQPSVSIVPVKGQIEEEGEGEE